MQNPFEEDTNSGVAVFVGCWIFTVIVGVTLILRFAVKAWIHWVLPYGFEPEGHWSLEDLLLLISYPIDVIHMTGVELGSHWGLGWHYDILDPQEQLQSLRYGYISQPFGTIAAMLSRMAAACAVLTAFGMNGTQTRFIVIGFIIFQAIINSVSVLQLVLQCGPSPYQPANRVQYFHYMWDYLPADGSVQCQPLSVQTDISRVQGGVNAVMDFCLAAAVMFDLWIMTSHVFKQHQGMPVWSRLRRARRTIQPGQVWMLLAFSGPLVFAGAASIVKIYKFQDFEIDFTYNAIGNVLWTKLENYTLVLASCAPLARLSFNTLIDLYHESQVTYHNEKPTINNIPVTQRQFPTRPANRNANLNPNPNPGRRTTWVPPYFQRYESRVSQASLPPQINEGFVTVQTDIVVEVDKRRPKSRSMSWFLRDTDSFKNTEARLERK